MATKKKFNLAEFTKDEEDQVETPVQAEPTATDAAESVVSAPVQKAGKKPTGYKMVNIRFTKENAEYLRKESAVRGMNMTSFVNWLVDIYKADPSHVHDYSLMDSKV